MRGLPPAVSDGRPEGIPEEDMAELRELTRLLAPNISAFTRQFGVGTNGKVSHGRCHDYVVRLAASLASQGLFGPALLWFLEAATALYLDHEHRPPKELRDAARSAERKFGPTEEEVRRAQERIARDEDHSDLGRRIPSTASLPWRGVRDILGGE